MFPQRSADQTIAQIVKKGSLTVDLTKDSGSNKHTFCIEADEVQRLLNSSGRSEDELLCDLIQQASSLARPPISLFLVGCVKQQLLLVLGPGAAAAAELIAKGRA